MNGPLPGRYEHTGTRRQRGGQATVFQARDVNTGQLVAIKQVSRPDEERGRRRFHREVAILRSLHGNERVISVRDTFTRGDDLFLVMDWIDGRSLRDLLDPVPRLENVLRWSVQICEGLLHCHAKGVVHRDIKPHNIMVRTNGDAVLIDFGIGRFTDSTATAEILAGSYAYLAPERWKERPGDHRTDLYAFGCVLYEMLTRDPPFGRGNSPLVGQRHLSEPVVPPTARRAGVPRSLNDLTVELLAKDPDERPAGAAEVIGRLRDLLHGPVIRSAEDRRTARSDDLYVDLRYVPDLRAAEQRLQKLTDLYGSLDDRSLQAREDLAELIAGSGDTTGAIRELDQVLEGYTAKYGVRHRRTVEVNARRFGLMRGH